MENRFGVDFSAIQVHTDSASASMCSEVGAKAFAVGDRIIMVRDTRREKMN
jgi:hypothetical protein